MKEPVLKAVCRPPEIFKAPFSLFFFNFMINVVGMVMGIVLGGMKIPIWWFSSPILWIGILIIGHLVLMGMQAKDPHVATMIMAHATTPKGSKNAVKHKGDKFSP